MKKSANDISNILVDVRNGDREAFEELYNSLKKPLFTLILRITHDVGFSEDILQELFLKIYVSPPEFTRNPRAYIFQMARNLAIDSIRKLKPEVELEEATEQIHHPSPDILQRLDIENALGLLSGRDRQIITLRINAELTFREIADILDIPLGTALWAYRQALKQLRNILEEENLK